MLKNESHLWDEKYKKSREYSSVDDYLQFSGSNPTVLLLEKYIKTGINILEIGSGTGELISYIKFKDKSVKAFGVDYSEVSIERSKTLSSKFNINVDFSVGNIKSLNFSDNTFDIVFGDQVIGHVDDINAVLVEIHRILKPGGLCFLSTVNKLRFDGWDLYKKISENHQGYTQRSFFPWKFKKNLTSSSFEFVCGYGDMIILMRNLSVIKNRIFGKGENKRQFRAHNEAQSSSMIYTSNLKKVYNWFEFITPWWLKISIGVVVRKP